MNWLYERSCGTRGRVDAGDPEPPERALLRLPVAVGVDERVLDLLLRVPVAAALEAPVALGLLEDLAPLLARVDRSLDSRHRYFTPSSFLTARTSLSATGLSLLKLRLRFGDLCSSRWLFIARRRRSFPAPVSLNRFFAPLCRFCFGIVSFHSRVLRWPQHHHHVPPVLQRRRLDHAELLDVLGEPHQQVPPTLRVQLLAPPEHDRDLDLRPLVEEADDVALLGVVVVNADLRPELDLLDLDLGLVLAGELGLLLLLVAVLAVVHHLGDGRIGLRRDLDEVEALRLRVLARLVRRLDPELRPVVVDEPDPR